MKLSQILNEERSFGQRMTRRLNKMLSWDYSNPKDMMEQIRNMSDSDLIEISKYKYAGSGTAGDGSARNLQLKLIDRELKRRFGVTPQGNMK